MPPIKPKKPNVPIPTGYVDPAKINSAPGVPGTIVPPAAPQLGGPLEQRKLGTNLNKPQAGAVVPGNEAKMQGMMDGTAGKPAQAGAGATGGKTPEQVAADNKSYKSLLRKFGLN
jgi:hypothetical protein